MAAWGGAWSGSWGAWDGGWNSSWRGGQAGGSDWEAVGGQGLTGGTRWRGRGRGHARGRARAGKSGDVLEEQKPKPHSSESLDSEKLSSQEVDDCAFASGQLSAPSASAASSMRVLFCPNPGPGRFTATYDASPAVEGFGSVNAGNGRSLRVGGSGLNGQFEKDLASAGQPVADFQRVHQALMSLACKAPGTLVQAPPPVLHRGLMGAFAKTLDASGRGFVVVDVFADGQRPLHASNVAMVYCVGPDRRQCSGGDEEFLWSLAGLGQGIVSTCEAYNRQIATGRSLPPLERVRVGLVSGGKYAGRVPKALVARNLLEGMISANYSTATAEAGTACRLPVEYELAYDEGVFEHAWQELLAARVLDGSTDD